MMKKIAILGSTGSIGTQTLEVVRYNKDIQVTALAAGSNVKLLEEQIREFKPRLACLWDEEKAKELRAAVADMDVKVASGMEGLMEAAVSPEADLVVTAVVGMIGIRPTIAAMEAGKDNPLHKILLTASGGPFRGFTREQLEKVRLEDALKHPNWSMGHKITIDSSTMVNKGLEVMEARWLFGVEMDQVQVVVQPASIIHSMVEFEDGAVIAQLGTPDMKLPIQYALYYPERRFLPGDRLDFEKLTKISFEAPDMETFRGLKLAYEAGRRGGTLPTVFNAANEMAVAMFLERKINYLTIVDMIEGAMDHHCVKPSPDVAQILEAEQETYDYITSKWN